MINELDKSRMPTHRMPTHIGIMMDGNRRWARKHLLPTAMGHRKGAEVFKERVCDLSEMGVNHATFFAFSTENFNRRADEISELIRLFETQLDSLKQTADKNVRLKFIGDLSVFSDRLRAKAEEAERYSANNTGMVCRVALNYGGRAEIVRAVNRCMGAEGLTRRLKSGGVSEGEFSEYLYTGDAPDVDLIIRTGGEKRLSNFLLWQSAYAELYFTDVLWCDFSRRELLAAIKDYAGRNRRFGE